MNLPTLAEVAARRAFKPIPKGSSRLQAKAEAVKSEAKDEQRWKAEVWKRDQGRCRHTHRKCKKTIELDPLRGECHHIEPRSTRAVRWDPRNGVLLSLSVHELVTRHVLRIEGTRFYRVDGQRFIDASFSLMFVKV